MNPRLLVKTNFHLLILLFLSLIVKGQELPPVTNYSPGEYGGGNQNWMISQGPDKKIYVANNAGLLQFDGEHWNLYKVPGETAVRRCWPRLATFIPGLIWNLGTGNNRKTEDLSITLLKMLLEGN